MAGNKIGAAKAAATNKARHGEDFYKTIGARGGLAKVSTKGFGGMSVDKRSAAGRKGGRISRRGPAKREAEAA